MPCVAGVCAPRGFIADGVAAGLKKDNALDMAFIYAKEGFSVEAAMSLAEAKDKLLAYMDSIDGAHKEV